MLKRRIMCGILAILSFFALEQASYAFSFKEFFGIWEKEIVEDTEGPLLKVYVPSVKSEPSGGITKSKIEVTKGAEAAAAELYDGKTDKTAFFEKDAEVTLDMGVPIFLSQIRYYAGEIDYKKGNNCLGTRFYASSDNKNFVELAVIEGLNAPENGWYDINFSGFGEYRYFRVQIPEKANICEVEWMSPQGFSRIKQGAGKFDVKLNLCAFDVKRDMDITILLALYNEKGIMKQVAYTKRSFKKENTENFDISLEKADVAPGDTYRVAMFGEDGLQPIQNPLNYRINGASKDFSVASVFSDNMVLQADKLLTVWGRAERGSEVEVSIENALGGGIESLVKADENSEWEVELGSFSKGGNYTMTVKSMGVEYEYKNITFGDVWLCTGQSNMDYYMAAGEETSKELSKPELIQNENIRLLNLWNKGIDGAAGLVDNPPTGGESWQCMNGDVAAYCSAVGYYFAKEIYEVTKEPVGIINVAVGDTEINRWIPRGDTYGTFTSTDGDLYNNRIYPFERLEIKGIILYQGEADQYRTHLTIEEYSDAMAGLVDKYRESWGEDLPFYWAQLTRYRVDETLVREGQRISLGKVKNKANTGMIVLNDIVGSPDGKTGSCRNDIHPWGKKTVAERFAAYAKRDCYGQNVAVSGPVYVSSKSKDGTLILEFECEGKLRVMPKERYSDKETEKKIRMEKIDTSKPMEFEVAGADGEYYKADAILDGKTVILKSNKVKNPVYARYAWGAYPEMPNLTDDTGLPTATFDTRNDI